MTPKTINTIITIEAGKIIGEKTQNQLQSIVLVNFNTKKRQNKKNEMLIISSHN